MELKPVNTHTGDDDGVPPASQPEELVWKGTPSQITNLLPFLLCILIIPIPWAFYRWLKTRNHVYEVTTQRIRETTGILNKQTDDMEIYRVKDMRLDQPFFLRLVGAGNIHLLTSDRTNEEFVLRAVRPKDGPRALLDAIRHHVEVRRDQKRVREIDMEPMDQG